MRFERSQFTVKSIGIMGCRWLIVFIRDAAILGVISYALKMPPELSHHPDASSNTEGSMSEPK
jgi:hypothetical protein